MDSKVDLSCSDENNIYPRELNDTHISNQDESKKEILILNTDQSHHMTMSLPVVPMRTLLQAYTQKKVVSSKREVTHSIRELIYSSDNSDSDEVEDKSGVDKVLEICKKLEDLLETQSKKISELTTEVQKLKNWKEQQGRLQATVVIQKYWRQFTSNNVKPKEPTTVNAKVMEKLKELNNEVILIKDFLKNLLEQSIKEGNTSQSQDSTSNNTTDFIEDLQVIIQSDTSLLLTWTEYSSIDTLGYNICINGHQVGMVSNEKTKALLEGLNPTSYYKINLVEQTSSSKARESNSVFVCISQMRSIQQELVNTESIPDRNDVISQVYQEDNTGEFPSSSYKDELVSQDEGDVVLESVEISGNSVYSGEKKVLNRTYELEKQLVEIRQQFSGVIEVNEPIDNN